MNILNRLTVKHLKMNKRRTIVTIIGVILSCALMMGVGLLFSSVYDNILHSTMKYNGSHHAIIRNVKGDQYHLLDQNVNVKQVLYEQILSYASVETDVEVLPYVILKNANDAYYKQMTLERGRYPVTDTEILLPSYYNHLLDTPYRLNDTITIQLGERRIDNQVIMDEQPVDNEKGTESFRKTETKTYQVVGFYENNNLLKYDSPGYSFYTKTGVTKQDHISAYLTFHSNQKIISKTEKIARELKKETFRDDDGSTYYADLEYNTSLLNVLGQGRHGNYNSMMVQVIVIMLTLVSIACIIVIYNSFNISVMERKKQFGLFSSIGATAKQLRYTVFYEALLISVIAIPIGILSRYIGIDIVIRIINHLAGNMMDLQLRLVVIPIFVLIPIIFMVIVIFVSAYLPAARASKVTPIAAIRQNDDIKLKGKKVKTNRLVHKFFGIEGDIALKNIKRNKKKYRITVVSLFISIVLFISFSGILNYGLYGSDTVAPVTKYDAVVNLHDRSTKSLIDVSDTIRRDPSVKQSSMYFTQYSETQKLTNGQYHQQYRKVFAKAIESNTEYPYDSVTLVKMKETDYQAYQKAIGLTEERPIIINTTTTTYFDQEQNRKTYKGPVLDLANLSSWTIYYDTTREDDLKGITLENFYETDQVPFGLEVNTTEGNIVVVLPERIYNEYMDLSQQLQTNGGYHIGQVAVVYVSLNDTKKFDQTMEKLKDANRLSSLNYYNVVEEQKMVRNMILVIKILLYGFIALVTLIGVTSVFNTISTSLALRKKEFAMLRSVGLTPMGFKKILWFESLFFVGKAFIYSLPVSLVVLYLVHNAMGSTMSIPHLLIPWGAVMVAILFAFGIVLLTTIYSTRKMRHENILEAIREENI